MRVLILRLSSFGDILQTLPAVDALAAHGATVTYLTKPSFSGLVKHSPSVTSVVELSSSGLWATARAIHNERFSHIYDAHNNLRSMILKLYLRLLGATSGHSYNFITRSKNRWKRFLFFKLRKPVFTMPFRGADSFITPLKPWGIEMPNRSSQHLYLPPTAATPLWPRTPFVAIAPSAAWPNKRWPVTYWMDLVRRLPHIQFVILGGPEDTFCEDIHQASPTNTLNLAGKLSLLESCAAVGDSILLISADTGLLHAADQLAKRCIALIGPTAFGYPFNDSSIVLETELYCKPCSKDGRTPCINPEYQKCMKDIAPQTVATTVLKFVGSAPQ